MKNNLNLENLLIIFAKEPKTGACKRRLAESIGAEAAGEFYKAFLDDTICRLAKMKDVSKIIAYTPDHATLFFKPWEDNFSLLPQGKGDLGVRMLRAFCFGLASGFKRVVIIGSDSPDLPLRFIREAFGCLSRCDVVIGPAVDGGYYLVGMKEPRDIFSGITWSVNMVYEQTLRKVANLGLQIKPLRRWRDVDTKEDLLELEKRSLQRDGHQATDLLNTQKAFRKWSRGAENPK